MNHQETILKALLQKPSLFVECDKYAIRESDFDNAFYRTIFKRLRDYKHQEYVTEEQWMTITEGESDPLWKEKKPDDTQHFYQCAESVANEKFWKQMQDFSKSLQNLEKTNSLEKSQEIHQRLFESLAVLKPARKNKEFNAKDTIQSLFIDSQKRKPIPTGYNAFDIPMKGGFRRGLPSVIAGPSGHGKTLVCVNFIVQMCLAGMKVDFLSLEMTKEEVMEKILYILMGEGMKNPFDIDEKTAQKIIDKANEKYEQYIATNLNIYDDIANGSEILAHIFENKDKKDVIYIDYIQRVNVDNVKSDNPFQKLGDFSLMLTESIKGSNTALILLSQITNKHEPFASQLKNTGQIENDIALDLRLMRERDEEDKPTGNLSFKALKNRFGEAEFECSIKVDYMYQRLGEYKLDPDAEPHVSPEERVNDIVNGVFQ